MRVNYHIKNLLLYFLLLLACAACTINEEQQYSESKEPFDLVDGFYEILKKESDNSRQMLLQEDSSLVYYIAEQPVVSNNDVVRSEGSVDRWNVIFSYNKAGTRKLLNFTTHHLGDQLGFVDKRSLRAIYTIDEIVDNGVIEIIYGPNPYRYRLLRKER